MGQDADEPEGVRTSKAETEATIGDASAGRLPQPTRRLWNEARQFAHLVFWVLDLRTKTFVATSESDLIPEWGLGQTVSLGTLRARLVPEDRRSVARALARLVKRRETLEGTVRFLRFSGLRRHIEVRAYPVVDDAGTVTAVQGLAREVTDRIATDMMRRQVAGHYRDFIDFSPHMPWIADPAGRIVEMSPRYEMLTGHPRSVWDTDAGLDHFHPDDIPGMVAAVTHSLSTGEPYESEYRIQFKDGQWHGVRATAVARRNEAGAIVAWYGFTEHIDRRERSGSTQVGTQDRHRDAALPNLRLSSFDGPEKGRLPSPSTFVPYRDGPGRSDRPNIRTEERSDIDTGPQTREASEASIEANHLCAARALLRWSMMDLVKASGLSLSTIRRLEEDVGTPKERSRHTAIAALKAAGILFLLYPNGGVAVTKI